MSNSLVIVLYLRTGEGYANTAVVKIFSLNYEPLKGRINRLRSIGALYSL